jgi:SAM-dependent methyltransferase
VRILSAPCGTAEDLFRALERVAARGRVTLSRVHVVAADLDPHGELRAAIRERAGALGVSVEFVRCDLTDPAARERLGAAPFDLALFVGLSGWIDKPSLLGHLAWLRGALRPSGVLVTDCFVAASYARSGWLAGFRASYYAPATYAALLDACGLAAAEPATGRDRLNHVLVARPRPPGIECIDRVTRAEPL